MATKEITASRSRGGRESRAGETTVRIPVGAVSRGSPSVESGYCYCRTDKSRERSFLFELCVRERTLLIAEVEKLDFILLETEAELTLPLCPTRSSSTILDAGKLELKAFTDPVKRLLAVEVGIEVPVRTSMPFKNTL